MDKSGVFVVLMFLTGALLIWATAMSVVFYRTYGAYRKLTEGVTKKDLKSVLTKLADALKNLENETDSLQAAIDEIEAKARLHLQKVGFNRFNPFSDTGGNQSFCLCLLDENNDGIVITSLHSRDQTRIYTKSITGGAAKDRELSKEEKQTVLQAVKRKEK